MTFIITNTFGTLAQTTGEYCYRWSHTSLGNGATFKTVASASAASPAGGAQFAHRFWSLHPHRIASLAIVAPGAVTLLDSSVRWPRVVQDEAVEVEALRPARVTIVVSDQDEGLGCYSIHVARCLRNSLHDAAIALGEEATVVDRGHEERKLQSALERWFESTIDSLDEISPTCV